MASSEKLFSLWNNYRKSGWHIYFHQVWLTQSFWYLYYRSEHYHMKFMATVWQTGVFFLQTNHSDLSNKGKVRCFRLNTDFFSRPNCAKASGVIQHYYYTLFSSLLKNVSDERGHWWHHKKPCRTEISGFSTTPQWVSSSSSNFNTGFASLACWRFSHEPTSDLLHHL